jgi:hypothetical protein
MRRLVLTTLVLSAMAYASEVSAQAAAISVSIPPTGRANGMGEAYVALADDATATWWNPGGLGFLPKKEVSVTYAKLVPGLADDMFYTYPTYAMPVKDWGTFGFGLVYLSYGTSEGTDQSGNPLGSFTSYEIAPTLSYGTKVTDRLGVGANFKYIRVQLSPDFTGTGEGKGSTFAFDLAGLYKVPGDMVNVGLAIQNLGGNLKFVSSADDNADPIYRNLKAGFAVNAYSKDQIKALVIGDVNQLLVKGEVADGPSKFPRPIYNFGAEVSYTSEVELALRGGYVLDKDGAIENATYGLGVGYKTFQFDLASIPQAGGDGPGEGLERVTKFSLGARF